MRTLDRYVIRSFLYSYLLCFLVMMGLRIVADLFVNMDEFAELDLSAIRMVAYVGGYYAYNSLVYFQEMGSVILVAAAAFSLARMNHTNELTAIMASGVSLHRVILPVVLIAMVLAVAGAVNQEVLIPAAKDRLVLDRDAGVESELLTVDIIVDGERNAWYSPQFDQEAQRMRHPLILCRDNRYKQVAKISGQTASWIGDGRWSLNDAGVALFSREAGGVGASSAFVLSPISPADLASGAGASEVGLIRIAAERVDPDGGRLIGPEFEILSPAARGLDGSPRVLATIRAESAWYGPAGDEGDQMGYHLEGPSALAVRDIRQWRLFCLKLIAHDQRRPNHPLRRIRAAMSEAVRADVQVVSRPGGARNAPAIGRILQAINLMLERVALFSDDDRVGRPLPLSPRDRRAAAADMGTRSREQIRRLNRYVLDAALPDDVVACQGELIVTTDLIPQEIALRQTGKWMDYMSSAQIGALLSTGRVPDVNAARLVKHLRFTAPIATIVMLLLGVPFIVSRQRHIKVSALACVLLVGGFHVFVFVCRYMGQDLYEGIAWCVQAYGGGAMSPQWGPILAAWTPMLVFGPVAALLLDSMENMPPPVDNTKLASLLLASQGRVGRRDFWLKAMVPLAAAMAVAWALDVWAIGTGGLLFWAVVIAAIWPIIAVNIKRCHDRGRPGWFSLVALIPVVGQIGWLVELGLGASAPGRNIYGADPTASRAAAVTSPPQCGGSEAV